jgi:hypothetical protein
MMQCRLVSSNPEDEGNMFLRKNDELPPAKFHGVARYYSFIALFTTTRH